MVPGRTLATAPPPPASALPAAPLPVAAADDDDDDDEDDAREAPADFGRWGRRSGLPPAVNLAVGAGPPVPKGLAAGPPPSLGRPHAPQRNASTVPAPPLVRPHTVHFQPLPPPLLPTPLLLAPPPPPSPLIPAAAAAAAAALAVSRARSRARAVARACSRLTRIEHHAAGARRHEPQNLSFSLSLSLACQFNPAAQQEQSGHGMHMCNLQRLPPGARNAPDGLGVLLEHLLAARLLPSRRRRAPRSLPPSVGRAAGADGLL